MGGASPAESVPRTQRPCNTPQRLGRTRNITPSYLAGANRVSSSLDLDRGRRRGRRTPRPTEVQDDDRPGGTGRACDPITWARRGQGIRAPLSRRDSRAEDRSGADPEARPAQDLAVRGRGPITSGSLYHEATASGRVTRRASSDPACLGSSNGIGSPSGKAPTGWRASL